MAADGSAVNVEEATSSKWVFTASMFRVSMSEKRIDNLKVPQDDGFGVDTEAAHKVIVRGMHYIGGDPVPEAKELAEAYSNDIDEIAAALVKHVNPKGGGKRREKF